MAPVPCLAECTVRTSFLTTSTCLPGCEKNEPEECKGGALPSIDCLDKHNRVQNRGWEFCLRSSRCAREKSCATLNPGSQSPEEMQAEILTSFRFAQAVDKPFYIRSCGLYTCMQTDPASLSAGHMPAHTCPWVSAGRGPPQPWGTILSLSPSHTPQEHCHRV